MKKVVFQMDHPSKINPKTDTTLLLMNEFLKMGIEVLYYEPYELHFKDGKIGACVRVFSGNLFEPRGEYEYDFDGAIAVFIRQDPPFDMTYITSLYLLQILQNQYPNIKFINNPAAILNFPEKLVALMVGELAKYTPKTLITSNLEQIRAFRREIGDLIIKPLYGFAGEGVFLLKKDDRNLLSVFDLFSRLYKGLPMIVQEYLPAVQQADKRVIIINGKIEAYFARVQTQDSSVSALRSGASTQKCDLTAQELTISNYIASVLKDKGILIGGIDLIGEKLTEINVTCPTGFITANRLTGSKLEAIICDLVVNF